MQIVQKIIDHWVKNGVHPESDTLVSIRKNAKTTEGRAELAATVASYMRIRHDTLAYQFRRGKDFNDLRIYSSRLRIRLDEEIYEAKLYYSLAMTDHERSDLSFKGLLKAIKQLEALHLAVSNQIASGVDFEAEQNVV